MARRVTEEAERTRYSNSKVRAETIRSVCKELAALDAERKRIGEERREVVQSRIKGDLDMKVADFNSAYRAYLLDDAALASFMDTMRETFSALGRGQTLDWITVAERIDPMPEAVAMPEAEPVAAI